MLTSSHQTSEDQLKKFISGPGFSDFEKNNLVTAKSNLEKLIHEIIRIPGSERMVADVDTILDGASKRSGSESGFYLMATSELRLMKEGALKNADTKKSILKIFNKKSANKSTRLNDGIKDAIKQKLDDAVEKIKQRTAGQQNSEIKVSSSDGVKYGELNFEVEADGGAGKDDVSPEYATLNLEKKAEDRASKDAAKSEHLSNMNVASNFSQSVPPIPPKMSEADAASAPVPKPRSIFLQPVQMPTIKSS